MSRPAEAAFNRLPDRVRRAIHQLRVRPGHYYSPYPDLNDLRRREAAVFGSVDDFAGIDMREDSQVALLDELTSYYVDLPFSADPVAGLRYHYGNRPYPFGDGVFLACLLQHLRPQRYVEIGSGYSTALALDVRDRFLAGDLDLTCVDPFPDRLRAVLSGESPERFELVERPVQDLGPELVADLTPNDVVLVDSTHVARAGSDVNHIVHRLLPHVPPGVYVHFHDVFDGFEYPREWVYQGRAWSEAYLLRAFLQFNRCFEVVLFTSWIQRRHPDWFAREMPLCGHNPGASLWIRRTPCAPS